MLQIDGGFDRNVLEQWIVAVLVQHLGYDPRGSRSNARLYQVQDWDLILVDTVSFFKKESMDSIKKLRRYAWFYTSFSSIGFLPYKNLEFV